MPIDYFEHIEYHFPIPSKIADLTEFADYFDKLRTAHDYNFMSETQMAQSFLTAIQGKVEIKRTWGSYLLDKVKDLVKGGVPHWHATITPNIDPISELAGPYARTLGVVIEKGAAFSNLSLDTTSDIYTSQGSRMYIGLDKPVIVGIQPNQDRLHLIRSNVPVEITSQDGVYHIQLQAAGLQQVKLYSRDELHIEAAGADIKHDAEAHTYTITRYGDAAEFMLTKAQQ
ncbi:hypothetical protein [Paenibacillus hexagrammi]|uniref:Uncharacterized protein n=1 Tax=Paenibacillus hexagrammi TaxID=2908839 RepID=A0ABY3SGU3_9BACL|nr:hypothetical protein [Paenibacillus sp. YPD9-1]UJF33161.1 hypothetical protein L0M14_27080 [Paenibacillus sp. YPD9-1]